MPLVLENVSRTHHGQNEARCAPNSHGDGASSQRQANRVENQAGQKYRKDRHLCAGRP